MKLEDIQYLLNRAYHRIDPEEPDAEQQYYNNNISQIRYALDNGLLKPEEIQGEDVLYEWINDGISDDELTRKIGTHKRERRQAAREDQYLDNSGHNLDEDDPYLDEDDLDLDEDDLDLEDSSNPNGDNELIELKEKQSMFHRVKDFITGLWNDGKEWIKKTFGNKSIDNVLTSAEEITGKDTSFRDGIFDQEAADAVYDVAQKYQDGELTADQVQTLQTGEDVQNL